MAEQSLQFKEERLNLINDIINDNLHGKHIYILGSAEFGPVNEPILCQSTVGVYNNFGKQGTLIDAFHAIKYVSKNNLVYLVKTTGEHASAYLNVNIQDGEIIKDGFILTSSDANEIYNDLEITVDIDKLTFTFPDELNKPPISYKYDDYKTIDELTQAINKDTKEKRSSVYAYYTVDSFTPIKNAFYPCNFTSNYMYGGQCGLNYSKNLLYNCLQKTYNILESHEIDIIIPIDAFMDDIYPDDSEEGLHQYNMKYYHSTKDYLSKDVSGIQLSFMDQLINFCIIQLNSGIVTNGILGYNSYYKVQSNFLGDEDDLVHFYKACIEYNLDCCDNPFYAFLVSVVVGDIEYNMGDIIDNGYLAYAALCADITVTDGTTNIPISDTIAIYQEFSEDVLQELAKSGIVVFRHSPLYEQPVVYDGITASPMHENLKLYCNVRMIQMCISYINRLFQFYVGSDIQYLIDDDIIKTDLDNVLARIQDKNIITSYEFTIVPHYNKGEINVYLSLQTCFMTKAVKLNSIIYTEFLEED